MEHNDRSAKKKYIDEDGNMQFDGQFLEEWNDGTSTTEQQNETSSMKKLFKKLLQKGLYFILKRQSDVFKIYIKLLINTGR